MNIEQMRPQWSAVHKVDDLISFLSYHFQPNGMRFYLDELRVNLSHYPERLENPLYLPFAARMLLTAAEYQYPGVVGHAARHNSHHFKRDLFSPPHLLALGIYIAKDAVQQAKAKAMILESWDASGLAYTREHYDALLASWVKPHKFFPQTDNFLFEDTHSFDVKGGRRDNLPIILPDISFLTDLSRIQFTSEQADTMRKDLFRTSVLRAVYPRVFPFQNHSIVDDLFLNDRSWD